MSKNQKSLYYLNFLTMTKKIKNFNKENTNADLLKIYIYFFSLNC